MTGGPRTLVVWCPDWPAVAAGCPPDVPAAVVEANRVVAVTPAARAEGVRAGLRRREAQGRCPGLQVVAADAGRDARAFEPVVVAVEAFAPGVEIVRPGLIGLATRGPSRYFGGDHELARRILLAVDAALGTMGAAAGAGRGVGGMFGPPGVGARVGVADGRFAAGLAARAAGGGGGGGGGGGPTAVRVVPPGESRAFLSPFPVAALPDADLADLLGRLGVASLGDLAALPAPAVLARFGVVGAAAHRLACGEDERPLAVRVPPPDLTVAAELDPPADRVDTAAFVARSLAGELHERLEARGLACTRVAIEAETEHGERLSRLWRHEGALGAAAIAERCRWQLDGWLREGGTTGGLTLLRLVPDEVGPADGRQSAFWGGRREDDEGMARALARVQGLLGPDAVVTAVVGGGRDPADAVSFVPWGEPRAPARPGRIDAVGRAVGADAGNDDPELTAAVGRHPSRSARPTDPPWPGRLPGPAPAVVPPRPLPAALRDATGAEPTVSGRGELSAPPVELSIDAGPWQSVEAWAGPWPLEERWWDRGRRRARLQVVAGGIGYLLAREGGGWGVEAVYD